MVTGREGGVRNKAKARTLGPKSHTELFSLFTHVHCVDPHSPKAWAVPENFVNMAEGHAETGKVTGHWGQNSFMD